MIELKLYGRCVNCPCVDVEVVHLYANAETFDIQTRCRNEALCDHLWNYCNKVLLTVSEKLP